MSSWFSDFGWSILDHAAMATAVTRDAVLAVPDTVRWYLMSSRDKIALMIKNIERQIAQLRAEQAEDDLRHRVERRRAATRHRIAAPEFSPAHTPLREFEDDSALERFELEARMSPLAMGDQHVNARRGMSLEDIANEDDLYDADQMMPLEQQEQPMERPDQSEQLPEQEPEEAEAPHLSGDEQLALPPGGSSSHNSHAAAALVDNVEYPDSASTYAPSEQFGDSATNNSRGPLPLQLHDARDSDTMSVDSNQEAKRKKDEQMEILLAKLAALQQQMNAWEQKQSAEDAAKAKALAQATAPASPVPGEVKQTPATPTTPFEVPEAPPLFDDAAIGSPSGTAVVEGEPGEETPGSQPLSQIEGDLSSTASSSSSAVCSSSSSSSAASSAISEISAAESIGAASSIPDAPAFDFAVPDAPDMAAPPMTPPAKTVKPPPTAESKQPQQPKPKDNSGDGLVVTSDLLSKISLRKTPARGALQPREAGNGSNGNTANAPAAPVAEDKPSNSTKFVLPRLKKVEEKAKPTVAAAPVQQSQPSAPAAATVVAAKENKQPAPAASAPQQPAKKLAASSKVENKSGESKVPLKVYTRTIPGIEKMTLAEQVQVAARVKLRETGIARSPGGTPKPRQTQQNGMSGLAAKVQSTLANKFRNTRASASPDERRVSKRKHVDTEWSP